MAGRNNCNSDSSVDDKLEIFTENGPTTDLMKSDVLSVEEAMNTVGVGMFQVKLVVLSGFVWMSRGFEMVLIRFISPLLTCQWMLKSWHDALLTTLIVLFTVLGCFMYGIWSDKYGRRTALSSSLIFLFVFGAVSAGLPSYTWFVIFRVVAGFAIGGLPQALVLCCEYMPSRQRGRAIYILSCFWALSVMLMLCCLYATMDTAEAWRVFTTIGAIPAFLAMVTMRFFPESFRFLLVSNHYLAANEIVCEMAEANKQNLGGHLYPVIGTKKRGRIMDILSGTHLRSTLLFWFMGLATTVCFLGLNVITPSLIFQGMNEPIKLFNATMTFMGNLHNPIMCLGSMEPSNFIFLIWTNALDFPGFVIYMILVDLIDRKKLLCGSYFISSICIFLFFVPNSYTKYHLILSYCARTLLMSQFDLLLLTTAETYPTTHRGTAVGLEAASFYLGEFLSFYIVLALAPLGIIFPVMLFGALTFISAIASLSLKRETRGAELMDTCKKR